MLAFLDFKVLGESVALFVAVMVAIGAGFGGLFYAFRSRQVEALKNEVEILRAELRDARLGLDHCGAKHEENEARILELERKIDLTVNIPLKEIAEHMQKTNKILSQIVKKGNQ